jgi:hypothetical protein
VPDDAATPERHDELDKDYTPEEQAAWDEQTEHEKVAEVTGVGPYDDDEPEGPGKG